MKSNSLAGIPLIGVFFLLIFSSCQKDDNNDTPGPNGGSSTIKTQVIVKTTDASNVPVAGTLIKIGSSVAITDSKGFAIFQDVTVSNPRFVVTAQKSGKLDAVKGISVVSGTSVYYATLIMVTKPTPVTFDASTGGNVTLTSGASVTFSAGTVAEASGSSYSGTVLVYAHHYKTDDPRFETMVPGGDLLGIDMNGDDVSLVSFGMLKVDLVDPSGNPLNLLPGTTAQITIPIAPSQQSSAPATIPLWYLDETTALWKEEGSATRQGNSYVGTVSHFSTWNCDYPGERANIIGKVVDCNNNPIPNVMVTLNGFLNLITDSAGIYTGWVPAGWTITYQVLAIYNQGLSSTNTVTFTAVANQTNQVPDLLIPCSSKIMASITGCTNTMAVFVELTKGSTVNHYFFPNGNMNLYVTQSGTYNIMITSLQGLFDTSIAVTQNPPQTYNLNNIQVCGYPSVTDSNSFYLDGGPFSNDLIDMVPVTTTGVTNSTGWNFTQFGTASPLNTGYNMEVQITGTLLGPYTIVPGSNASFEYVQGDYTLSVTSPSDEITLTVDSIGPVGGLIICSFSGTATIYDQITLTSFPATISDGKLSFTRY